MPKRSETSSDDDTRESHSLIKLIDNGKREITDVYHISDIHIRNTTRHQEYRQVFERTYRFLSKSIGENRKTSLIVLTGDIMHTKTEMSPESFTLAQEFLQNLAAIAPVILIPGNHDCNLSNADRMDALSPVVYGARGTETSAIPDLYYLKYSGFYQYFNVVFGVSSVLSEGILTADQLPKSQWRKIKQANKYRIALYHGPVHQAKTDVGYRMNREELLAEHFEGYEFVMLGDIHRYQYLNCEKTIAYAGSLIQQSHGEKLKGHGVLHWDLTDGVSRHHEIANDYGYHTLRVTNGELEEIELSRKPRLRFILDNTDNIRLNEIIKKLATEYDVQEIVKDSTLQSARYLDSTVKKKKSINKVSSQETMIRDYLTKKGHTPEEVESIISLHASIHKKVFASDQQKLIDTNNNKKWRVLELRFSNTLSYGANNVIDFTRYEPNNIIGIVAPNHYGKSAILDVMLFCLFDKCSRGERRDILNKNEKSMFCSLLFSTGNQKYLIERIGNRSKNGLTVKIDVNFYEYTTNKKGKEVKVKLNGTDKNDTNRKIAELIGDYQDYLTTCFCLQQGRTANFIEMTQLQKKEYLHEILRLNVFESCHAYARDKLKELTGELKSLEQRTGTQSLDELREQVIVLGKSLKRSQRSKDHLVHFLEEICPKPVEPILPRYQELEDFDLTSLKKIERAMEKIREELGKSREKVISSSELEKQRKTVQKIEEEKEEIQTKRNRKSEKREDLRVKQIIYPEQYEGWSLKEFRREIKTIQSQLDSLSDIESQTDEDLEDRLTETKKELARQRRSVQPCHGYTPKDLSRAEKSRDQALESSPTGSLDPATVPVELRLLKDICQEQRQLLDALKGLSLTDLKPIIREQTTLLEKRERRIARLESFDQGKPDSASLEKKVEEIQSDLNVQKANEKIQKRIRELESLQEKLMMAVCSQKDQKAKLKEKAQLQKTLALLERYHSSFEENHQLGLSLQQMSTEIDELDSHLGGIRESLKKERAHLSEMEEKVKQQTKLREARECQVRRLKMLHDFYYQYIHWEGLYQEYRTNLKRQKEIQSELEEIEKEITRNEAEMVIRKNELTSYLDLRKKYDEATSNVNLYQMYIQTMNYNGIPYEMLKSYLPMIEADVNQILHAMVSFNVEFKFIEEKVKATKTNTGTVDVNICYENSFPYNVQLTSGFEKFIINLAIRMTLCQISLTSKPNFLIIDEGWSCLDRDNLNNIETIMNYIKSQYDHVILISHLEELRNQSDYVINIDRKKGRSYLAH